MPALGSYDSLEHVEASLTDVNNARIEAEKLVPTSVGVLQYDVVSRQRLIDALNSLDTGDPTSTVTWGMADNSRVMFNHEELALLIKEANALIGTHSIRMYEKASYFKDLINIGSKVNMREIAPEAWKY